MVFSDAPSLSAQIVAMVLQYPMLILSGAAWPRELMLEVVLKISAFLSLTFVMNLLHGLWFNAALSDHLLDIFILSGMLVIGNIISVKTFCWE